MISLFRTRRFLPLFLTQFLGAMNDNLLKNALVVLVTYRIAAGAAGNAQTLVTLAAGLFILPFFLLSATAGQVADKYDKAAITRIIKIAEICIMGFASVGFFTQSTWLLLVALFGMGVHSTFFGPIKYALLPQQLRAEELLAGNSYVEAGTFLAILLGTIFGGLLILAPDGVGLVCCALLGVAVLGYACGRFIPTADSFDPGLRIGPNIWRETVAMIAFARHDAVILRCILGISWFWLVGATLLAEFAPFVKSCLHADASVVTLLLTVFSVGIGLGSLICNALLHGRVRASFVPWAALGISAFGVDLFFASRDFGGVGLAAFGQFVAMPRAWRVVLDLLGMAVSGGVYIVPLYAIMQSRSEVSHRSRIIAANNVVNSLFMVAAAVGTLILLSLSVSIPQVFLLVALANGFVAVYMFRLKID